MAVGAGGRVCVPVPDILAVPSSSRHQPGQGERAELLPEEQRGVERAECAECAPLPGRQVQHQASARGRPLNVV